MTRYEMLYLETTEAREWFLSIPLVRQAVASGGSRELYVAFLTEAYHHVKHTFPLLALAASMTRDERYQAGLLEYMTEERGHEKWILDDIQAMGGNAEAVANGKPGIPCQAMVAYCYYAIQWISPYAILGMVHVLEGLSVQLAHQLAGSVKQALRVDGEAGFTYLNSHGGLDVEHVELFKSLINGFDDPRIIDQVIESTRIIYRLYGAIFAELGAQPRETARAA